MVGDQNTTTVTYTKTTLPPAENVDMASTLKELGALLRQLRSEEMPFMESALEEAEHHLAKPEPDKDRIGQALDRALDYASTAEGFVDTVSKLVPHVKGACAWLGKNWYKLLGFVGLMV